MTPEPLDPEEAVEMMNKKDEEEDQGEDEEEEETFDLEEIKDQEGQE